MKHYVVSYDFGYEGLGSPLGVYTNLRKLKREHPTAVSAEEADASVRDSNKVFDGLVYHTFVGGKPI